MKFGQLKAIFWSSKKSRCQQKGAGRILSCAAATAIGQAKGR